MTRLLALHPSSDRGGWRGRHRGCRSLDHWRAQRDNIAEFVPQAIDLDHRLALNDLDIADRADDGGGVGIHRRATGIVPGDLKAVGIIGGLSTLAGLTIPIDRSATVGTRGIDGAHQGTARIIDIDRRRRGWFWETIADGGGLATVWLKICALTSAVSPRNPAACNA